MRKKYGLAIMIFMLFFSQFAPYQASASGGLLELERVPNALKPGSKIKIRVNASQVQDLYGLQFRLNYNSSLLRYEEMKISNRYINYQSGSQNEEGQITAALIRKDSKDTSYKKKLQVAEVTFTALKSGPATLQLDNLKAVTTENYLNGHEKNDLRILPLEITKELSFQISPSPGKKSSPSINSSVPSQVSAFNGNIEAGLTFSLAVNSSSFNREGFLCTPAFAI
ncbi:cohesin domain-containing protein [Paenibacillus solani]|uniref:cohesin domain-containing protein n=1 Tax=Paenibacillus solani TaxID=1705565 RepID=UPI003D294900